MPKCIKPTEFGSCRWCIACSENYLRSWVLRMILESYDYAPSKVTFLTLTYNEKSYPASFALAKRDWQVYCRSLRKMGFEFRFVASIERGDKNGRLHWHAIMYGIDFTVINKFNLEKKWGRGFIKWKLADAGAMSYVMKYVLKSRLARKKGEDPGSVLMSRMPGIGSTQIIELKKKISKLSTKEIQKLRGTSGAFRFSKDLTMSIPPLRVGGYWYSMHRYLKDRLKIPLLPDHLPFLEMIYETEKEK